MILAALIFFPLALIGLAYGFQKQALMLAAIGAWIILGVYALTESAMVWGWYYGLAWLCLGLSIVTGLLAIGMRTKDEEEPAESSFDRHIKRVESHREKMDRVERAINPDNSGSRRNRNNRERR